MRFCDEAAMGRAGLPRRRCLAQNNQVENPTQTCFSSMLSLLSVKEWLCCGGAARYRKNQSRANRATVSNAPGSSKRCLAPGTISSRFTPLRNRQRLLVYLQDWHIEASDKQRRWNQNFPQRRASEI